MLNTASHEEIHTQQICRNSQFAVNTPEHICRTTFPKKNVPNNGDAIHETSVAMRSSSDQQHRYSSTLQ
jgi:hypothetical protein